MTIVNNVTYTVRVRELCSWMPSFVDHDNESDEKTFVGDYDKNGDESIEENDIESVADIMAEPEIENFVKEQEIEAT
ncbi:hypothetical protein Tco_0476722, partial [Tanacetum coccineum]